MAPLITASRVRAVLLMGCFALSKTVDWTEHWPVLRGIFMGSLLLCLACFAQLHQMINARNERNKTVKVSNKAEDGNTIEEVVTYKDYDLQQLSKLAFTTLTSYALSYSLYIYFKIKPPLLLQSVLQPLAVYENNLSKIYFMGEPEESGIGKRPFKEQANELAEMLTKWGEKKEGENKKKEERRARYARRRLPLIPYASRQRISRAGLRAPGIHHLKKRREGGQTNNKKAGKHS